MIVTGTCFGLVSSLIFHRHEMSMTTNAVAQVNVDHANWVRRGSDFRLVLFQPDHDINGK